MLVWVRVPPLALFFEESTDLKSKIVLDAKVTKKGNFECVVEVAVPESELAPHFNNAFEKYRRNVKLQGFRKGKVPMSLIQKLYGDVIKSEAIDHVVQSVFEEVKNKENLRPVAPAQLEDVKYDPEDGLHFKAVVEVVPEIELKNYTGLSVERETYQVDDQNVEDALADVRERMAVMEPVEGEAQKNHFLVVDFQELDVTGLPIIGRKYEERVIQLVDTEADNDLGRQLLGAKAGEKRQVEIEVVAAGGHKERTRYEVNVKEIKSKQLPALDDDLAKDVGEFKTLEALKVDIRKKLLKQSEANARSRLRQRLIDELLKKNAFDLPESMITNYLDMIVAGAKRDGKAADEDALRTEYRPTAVWTIKWELAQDKLQELKDISVTKEHEDRVIARIAHERSVEEKELRRSLKDKNARRRFEEDVLEEKILDFLEENAKIKDKKVTRKDLETAKKKIALPS